MLSRSFTSFATLALAFVIAAILATPPAYGQRVIVGTIETSNQAMISVSVAEPRSIVLFQILDYRGHQGLIRPGMMLRWNEASIGQVLFVEALPTGQSGPSNLIQVRRL